MVFTPTQQPTSVVPDVKIFFHGQLFLRSEDGKTCEVGVNPLATNHVLSIEVRTKISGALDLDKIDLINMRHFGPLNFRQPGMTIGIDPPQIPYAFKCVSPEVVDPEAGTGPPYDFRWLLNLEGNLFHHDRQLTPTIFGTQNVITLQDGQFFFDTARRSDARLVFERTGGGKNLATLRRIGAVARANAFLAGNQSVVLQWHDGNRQRELRLTKADSVTYEIYIENTPLYVQVNPSDLGNPTALALYEELNHYYKVIGEIPAAMQFKLTPKPAPGPQAGSPTIPCQVIILDGPG